MASCIINVCCGVGVFVGDTTLWPGANNTMARGPKAGVNTFDIEYSEASGRYLLLNRTLNFFFPCVAVMR